MPVAFNDCDNIFAIALRSKCTNWDLLSEKSALQNSFNDLKLEMKHATGYHKGNALAIACPQIALAKRGFIMAMPEHWKSTDEEEKYKDHLTFVNPIIVETSSKVKLHWEGCLSFPE